MIALKFQLRPHALTSSSRSELHSSTRNKNGCFSYGGISCYLVASSYCWRVRKQLVENENHDVCSRWHEFEDRWLYNRGSKRMSRLVRLASTDDGVTINGSPQTSAVSEIQGKHLKFGQSLEAEDPCFVLIQSLHDAARVNELAIVEHSSSSETSWFSKAWLGVDRNAWVKTLSYQAAIYSLLQATVEIASKVDGRDRDFNMFIQRSLMRLSSPLESLIKEELSTKQPRAYDWFWSHEIPMVVMSFVNLLEFNPWFGMTMPIGKEMSSRPDRSSYLSILKLALSCIAAITKLGSSKVSCAQFFSMVPDISGQLMDRLVEFVPIRQAYSLVNDIGMRREFLLHFGPRAAIGKVGDKQDVEEITFWIDIVQKQLQKAIDRERIWSRLTTCESIEVLEKDLAIFGFFIALGRSTQAFLSLNGHSVTDHAIERIIRYFIGGSVLYYPQLSSISSYQLYVEVVCEELAWLPFYGTCYTGAKLSHHNKPQVDGLPDREVVSQILDVCSHWTRSFIKYSLCFEDPSNIKAARFLSRGQNKLNECRKEFDTGKGFGNEVKESFDDRKAGNFGSYRYSDFNQDADTFDKALENVEEAINRLEGLLQELHLSNSSTRKEHLEAACCDLQKIRKLKKEAEFLEASFRAKAASMEEDNNDNNAQFSENTRRQYLKSKNQTVSENGGNSADNLEIKKVSDKYGGLWNFLSHHSNGKMEPQFSSEDENSQQASSSTNPEKDSELNEMYRFEVLRTELIELERRVIRSSNEVPVVKDRDDLDSRDIVIAGSQHFVKVPKEQENIISKSIDKLKETTVDVWQGTQLLAIDTVAATTLVRRALTGDELAEKEKQALRRTFTDLASVVPIGILMLLPVTAVGHAAMLAAIQRYAPFLIPSTYSPERLALLRQLEKMKEMESDESKSDENGSSSSKESKELKV